MRAIKMSADEACDLVAGEDDPPPRFAVVEGGIRLLVGHGRDESFLTGDELKRVGLQGRGGRKFFKTEVFHHLKLVGEGQEGECIFM